MTDGWRTMESAPRDGTPFLALNHDFEVWVAKYDEDGRILFRSNGRREPRSFEHVTVNGETLLREDKKFARENECWENVWTVWTRLYEFSPVAWIPLPQPPKEAP